MLKTSQGLIWKDPFIFGPSCEKYTLEKLQFEGKPPPPHLSEIPDIFPHTLTCMQLLTEMCIVENFRSVTSCVYIFSAP